jgi:hypothetical protein
MARETFIDPAGKPFEIDSDLLASHGHALQRFRERALGRRAVKRASTRSSRYGELPGSEITVADFRHAQLHLCAHGQPMAVHSCGERHCSCPGVVLPCRGDHQ